MAAVDVSPGAGALMSGDIDSYAAALQYLGERINIERMRASRINVETFKLDRMAALLDALGNPHNDVRCVHIAGSKGKGSTTEMVAAALSACGYATGIYTSPHLVDVRERIRISAEMIGYSQFARLMRRIAEGVEKVSPLHGDATYFEVLTALAMCYFAEQAVDVAVIEVGLGGRLDSTNLVHPEVTAITAIHLEHTQILGDTLAKIAREKAGIFKPGVRAITVPQAPEAMEVLRAVAEERAAPLDVLGESIEYSSRFIASPELGQHARVSVHLRGQADGYEHIPVPLRGEHQAINCGLALAILLMLRARDFVTPERQIVEGLARTPAGGRMELIPSLPARFEPRGGRGGPRVVLDGAHTPESIEALMRGIAAHLRYDSMVVIFGCADDKDLRAMLKKIALGADKIIFTRSRESPRALTPAELLKRYAEAGGGIRSVQTAGDLTQAIELARAATTREDLICITGSFHLAGEAKDLLLAGQ
jgi:dihydrofolate synthase / folylpolyglutamate synthase